MKMLKAKLYELEFNKRNAAAKVLEDSQVRRQLGQPDPQLRARPVAHQGSAHGGRDRQHHRRARRRSRRIHASQPEAGSMSDEDENHLIAERRAKLARSCASAAAPFPNDFRARRAGRAICGRATPATTQHSSRWRPSPVKVRVGGRMRAKRVMGKASFAKLEDMSGAIQVFLQHETLGRAYEDFKGWDVGDIIGAEGVAVPHQDRRAVGARASRLRLLTKSLRPLPDKWHGIADTETALPAALRRPDHERGEPPRVRDALADRALPARVPGRARLPRGRDADAAAHTRAARRRGRSRPTTMRSTWTCTCASRRSCT